MYLAITSNTFQLGSRVEAGIEIGPISAHGWFGFDAEVQQLVVLYCLTLLLPAPMTVTALFRLFGRFGLYARGRPE